MEQRNGQHEPPPERPSPAEYGGVPCSFCHLEFAVGSVCGMPACSDCMMLAPDCEG
jgi:hypothetical protein